METIGVNDMRKVLGVKQRLPNLILSLVVAVSLLVALQSCRRSNPQPESSVRAGMQDVYSATTELFRLVWSPGALENPTNSPRVMKLLDRLAKDFHNIERDAPVQYFEPGFRLALQLNQELIRDARGRFAEGDRDYAQWRLRSLTSNCVACHSRYQIATDFLGDVPRSEDPSFEARFATAQFLVASRQFDEGTKELMVLARTMFSSPSGGLAGISALKEWLVVQVRVKQHFAEAATELSAILKGDNLSEENRELIGAWVGDLSSLSSRVVPAQRVLKEARGLMSFTRGDDGTFIFDEKNLVKSLRTTALMHEFLQGAQVQTANASVRRTATYLLALAYAHMPIRSLDAFPELYLEQCVREYPDTKEAMQCFLLYQDVVEERNTGSAGVFMDAETQQKLRELRTLAFGNQPRVLDDSIAVE